MSTIKTEVCKILEIRTHHNADALELATVQGWQMCVKKGEYQPGDLVVYFEQGTVLPKEIAEKLGVSQYLAEKTDIHGDRVLVVNRVKLRGEPSFGLVIPPAPDMALGDDVADFYGAVKYYPPTKFAIGDSAPDDPQFPKYTDLENMRSYPELLVAGEPVVATEKIHGTNCRVGYVWHSDEAEPTMMAGSRGLRRKPPADPQQQVVNTYWFPHTLLSVNNLFQELQAQGFRQAVLYGEVYGQGIQSYTYGEKRLAFRAFDLMVNGEFLGYGRFKDWCDRYQIPMAPLLYEGPYSLAAIKAVSDGASVVGGAQGREGVVVKPILERHDAKLGRVILKYVGDQYLFGKAASQDTTDL